MSLSTSSGSHRATRSSPQSSPAQQQRYLKAGNIKKSGGNIILLILYLGWFNYEMLIYLINCNLSTVFVCIKWVTMGCEIQNTNFCFPDWKSLNDYEQVKGYSVSSLGELSASLPPYLQVDNIHTFCMCIWLRMHTKVGGRSHLSCCKIIT